TQAADGIVFLPYRSCRSEWEQILQTEINAGRAAGALLYSLKDDAAQAAERAALGIAPLQAPVWMVNHVAGRYLAEVQKQGSEGLPEPPTGVEYRRIERRVARSIESGNAKMDGARVLVAISRSAADVAAADRNFFLKAMVGVGITGIVCFLIAMAVRYFDCLRSATPWPRHRDAAEDPPMSRRWLAEARYHRAGAASKKRVLLRHELDTMPCVIVTERDLGLASAEPPLPAPKPAALVPLRVLNASASCPHLPGIAAYSSEKPGELQRMRSVQNVDRLLLDHCQPAATAAAATTAPGGWDDRPTMECAICLDDLVVGDVVRKLPCPHVFHATCIDRWLLFQSSVCPLCKRDTLYGSPFQ
ncbi:hypothetical protein H4R20_004584, partial [Coemansia guatemalensis]